MGIKGRYSAVLGFLALLTLGGPLSNPAHAAAALDGEGIVSVSPGAVAYAGTGLAFTFTFTANIGDFGPGSQVAITVPAGWTAPSTTGTLGLVSVSSGTCTLSGSPPFGVTGSTIFVDMASCLAGQYLTVTYSGVTPAGPIGSPYIFQAQTDIGTGGAGLVPTTAGSPFVVVTPAPLTVSGGLTPANKTYDGTTAASLTTGTPTLMGVLGADVVSLDATGATAVFADRNVGTAKPVTVSGLVLAGADAVNYTLTPPTRSANISPRAVTITAATDNRMYDGTTASAATPMVSAATPLAGGDTPGALNQRFNNRNVGSGRTLTPAGVVSDGNGGSNYAYTFVPVATGVITPRPVTVVATSTSKIYDGTTGSAVVPTISPATPLGTGDAPGTLTQSFDSRNAGAGRTLTPAGLVSDGNGGLNYVYTFVSATGAITRRPVTIAAVADSKVYDGTSSSLGVPMVSPATPLVGGDTPGALSQSFDSRNAGTGKALIPSGSILDGNGGLNYAYALAADHSGVISPRPVTVTAVADSKGYDGTTASTGVPIISVATPLVSGDTPGTLTQSFGNRNVGTGKTLVPAGAILDGNSGLNYAYTYSTVASGAITPRPVTVTASPDSKVYDGTVGSAGAPSVSAATPLGSGDTPGPLTQSFDNRNVGTGKTLIPTGMILDGNGGQNYAYNFVSGAAGTITPRAVTIAAVTDSKVYDGTIASRGVPSVSAATPLASGDTPGPLSQSFDNGNVGTGKALIPAGTILDGNGGQNYAYTFTHDTTGSITPTALTISAAGLIPGDRAYDGTTTASLTTGNPTLQGVVGADAVTLVTGSATAAFSDRNVGQAKTVIISGLSLAGAAAGNYTLTVPARTASITPRPVTLTAAADSKIYDGTAGSAGVPVVSAATPLAGGDTPGSWTQSFDNRNAGTGKTLTPAGTVNDGNGGRNYAFSYATNTTGVITARPITVTASSDSKAYDGTTSSAGVPVLSALTPLAPGDTEPAWIQSFDSNTVGTGKTLTPAGAVNDGNGGQNYAYTFLANTAGAITQRDVTVEADGIVKALGTPDPPLTYRVTAGLLVAGDTLTLSRAPGEAEGVYSITIDSFPAAADYNLTYVAAQFTITPTVQFISDGALDGWVLESSRMSSVGGSMNAAATALRLGDDGRNRQYRAILSFDTSLLPDNAVIQSAVLQLASAAPLTGKDPFTVMGPLRVDIRKGTFGKKALAASDFQAKASAVAVGVVGKDAVNGWYTAPLNAVGMGKINTTGITQLRLYFRKGDNNNRKADFMSCGSGNAANGQPQLVVTYALP